MNDVARATAAIATAAAAAVAGGCSDGPQRISFDKPLPACSAFVPVVTSAGMPGPHLQAQCQQLPGGLRLPVHRS
jgi:hypothetical protein